MNSEQSDQNVDFSSPYGADFIVDELEPNFIGRFIQRRAERKKDKDSKQLIKELGAYAVMHPGHTSETTNGDHFFAGPLGLAAEFPAASALAHAQYLEQLQADDRTNLSE